MSTAGRRSWRLLDPVLLVGVAVLYLIAVRTGVGQAMDDLAFEGRKSLHHPSRQAVGRILDLTTGPVVITILALVVADSWRRRQWRFALGAVVATGGAVVVARVLKERLARPELLEFTWAGPGNTYPSGHVAAATAVVVLGVAAVPPELRSRAVRLGAVAVAAHAVGVLVAGWHRPSDVLAAIMIGAAASGPVCDIVGRRVPQETAVPGGVVPDRREVGRAGGALIALLLVSYLLPPSTAHSFPAFLAAALLVASLAGTLVVLDARRAHPAGPSARSRP